ncbi:MAG: ribosomal RNA small subunit methyltransferase A [Dehalococcoidia bacterium]|nr:ribosomal RNA small subunit methyltransferase A [Dehalococcoidia bacterium]|tara:strand:- start:743 stop:1564 length:822 start_codon:yes stop_codon:yes gene_type:complete
MSPKSRGPRARKVLGQHFLIDTGVLSDIAGAVRVPPGGLLLEIGAGTGHLTETLLKGGHEVIAVELETRLLAHLQRRFTNSERLTLVQGDARILDLNKVVPAGRSFSVAGNLPYFAANPIIRHLLEGTPLPTEMVVMVQREVGRELAAKPGKLSLLGISVQNYAVVDALFDVPPNAFNPPPAVHSSVVRLTLREMPVVPLQQTEAFFALVSGTFRNPRKQIHNALARNPGYVPELIDLALKDAGVDPQRRPETLSIPEWLALLETFELADASA